MSTLQKHQDRLLALEALALTMLQEIDRMKKEMPKAPAHIGRAEMKRRIAINKKALSATN